MNTALVIVAHPDDETIWMGGTLLRKKEWDWTIVSLCRSHDSDRAPKFASVCSHFGAQGIISDLDDEHLRPLSISAVAQKINEIVPKRNFDYIFTHGANGEYGHLRHREIHSAVTSLVQTSQLSCDKLMYFSLAPSALTVPKIPELHIPLPTDQGVMKTLLNGQEHREKQRIVHQLYGFPMDSFEVLSCNQKEVFTQLQ